MGSLVAAIASSHAFAVAPPEKWDELRERNRSVYAQRQNITVPPPHPRVNQESSEDVRERYGRVRNGLLELKRIIEVSKPDALIVIGDDRTKTIPHRMFHSSPFTRARRRFFSTGSSSRNESIHVPLRYHE